MIPFANESGCWIVDSMDTWKQTLAELVVAKKEVEVLNMTVTWMVERE